MEFVVILFLILVNGMLAMAEIAIVSSRKSRLKQMAQSNVRGAEAAHSLAVDPSRFLSTIQVGITLVSIIAGAYGGATLAQSFASELEALGISPNISSPVAIASTVTVITYLSLVIGELVPKQIGLSNPERVASYIAPPMSFLSRVASPLVSFLSTSTNAILHVFQISKRTSESVSEEEVQMLIREGTQSGVFEAEEKDIFERTLRLNDRKVSALMTPRKEVVWLNAKSPAKTTTKKLLNTFHSHYPVCDGSIDKVLGVVRTKDLFADLVNKKKIRLSEHYHKPLFVPESMGGLKVLEMYKKSGIHLAIVVDEYGNVEGVLSLNDVLEAIVGDIPTAGEDEEHGIVKREDGSWLVDGLVSTDEFKDLFKIKTLPEDHSGLYHTIGGYVVYALGDIPSPGDSFEVGDYKVEVVDMDENRVDKVLVFKKKVM